MDEVECIEDKIIHISLYSMDEIQVIVSLFLKKKKNYLIFIRLFLQSCIAIPEKIEILCNLLKNIINSQSIEDSEDFFSKLNNQIKTKIFKSREIKFAINFLIENEMIPSEIIETLRPLVTYKFNEYLAIDGNKVKIDQEFHHNCIIQGQSPSKIVEYIRNDDLDSLQTFFNDHSEIEIDKFLIEKSEYERCEVIFEKKCTLIDCSAFFGSIKCFKYFYDNLKITFSTFNFAIMGGNIEIIHLVENKIDDITTTIKNNSIFILTSAIKYHRTSIFEWLFNLIIPIELDTIQYLIMICCLNSSYEILNHYLIHKMEFTTLVSIYIDENIYDYIVTDSFFKLKREKLGDKVIFANFKNAISQLFFNSIQNNQLDCLKIIVNNSPFIGELTCAQFIDIIMKEYENNNFEIIHYLLNSQIFDINIKNKLRRPDHFAYLKFANQSKSLLLFSCDSNLEKLIDELLEVNSIDPNSECDDQDFNRRNAFDSCCENCSKNILNLFLLKFKKTLNIHLPLHFACRGNKIENFQYLISNIDIDINKVDHLNRTCLHYACECNNLIFLKEILANPKTKFDVIDKKQNSPYFSALKNGSIECIKYLLNYNNSSLIDINETDIENNDSALHIACKSNNLDIIKLVLPNPKIDINIQNKESIFF